MWNIFCFYYKNVRLVNQIRDASGISKGQNKDKMETFFLATLWRYIGGVVV
jgi:hypothetical protein